MALFSFKSKGSVKRLVDLVYPVGSLYMSTNSTNPSTLFGGTWQPYAQGRCLIGAGQGDDGTTSMSFTAGSIGGTYKEKLTVENLPSHDHALRLMVNTYAQGGGTTNGAGIPYPSGNGAPNYVEANGGNVAHNNLQPYMPVYIWRRTA